MLIVDYSWAHPDPAKIKAAGYAGVMRYLARKVDAKLLQSGELAALHAAGLAVGVVWETTAARAGEGAAAGLADVADAERLADALGMPAECPIFYAVDFGAATADVVRPYFRAVLDNARRPVGVYGSWRVVEGLPEVPYVWQCAAWSSGRISDRAHLWQRVGHTSQARADLGSTDENRVYQALPLWTSEGVMLINPTAGRITRAYSATPVLNPATGAYSAHLGTDVANATGTPIKAPAAGKVKAVRTDSYPGDKRTGLLPGRTGNGVIIAHDGGYLTYHGHVSRVVVAPGQAVGPGQVIAYVGATGAVTGPHNHTEVHVGGITTDPAKWYAKNGVKLGTDPYSVAYVREVQRLLGILEDGDLGPKTIAAVEAFQRSRGLVVDGDPGPITLAALRNEAIPPAPPAPTDQPAQEDDMAWTDPISITLPDGAQFTAPAGDVLAWANRFALDARDRTAALEAKVAALTAPTVAPVDVDALAAKVADVLAARLAS